MRKLATIETIIAIKNHDNADSLEIALVRGWQVVIRKGEFHPGDKIVYFEIDSWIPTTLAPFLSKDKEPHVYEGIKGERLRTIKLRNELSQGLIIPVPDEFANDPIGTDLTEKLNIKKWEPVIPAQLQGQIDGNFPSFIRKTDQERVQNCFSEMCYLDNYQHGGIHWIIEEKLDGSSATVFVDFKPDVAAGIYEIGICSRNFQLKINEENQNNTYIKTITEDGYLDHIFKLGESIAIQGEICGPGIQGNKYKLQQATFFVFDVFLINLERYATREERWNILQKLIEMGVNVKQVPHLGTTKIPNSIQECLIMSEGKSKINPNTEREGIVFKTQDVIEGQVASFKAISTKFLLQEK